MVYFFLLLFLSFSFEMYFYIRFLPEISYAVWKSNIHKLYFVPHYTCCIPQWSIIYVLLCRPTITVIIESQHYCVTVCVCIYNIYTCICIHGHIIHYTIILRQYRIKLYNWSRRKQRKSFMILTLWKLY